VFQIVGELEADVKLGLISITSPIARALVGKSEGSVVDVAVPAGRVLRDSGGTLRLTACLRGPAGRPAPSRSVRSRMPGFSLLAR